MDIKNVNAAEVTKTTNSGVKKANAEAAEEKKFDKSIFEKKEGMTYEEFAKNFDIPDEIGKARTNLLEFIKNAFKHGDIDSNDKITHEEYAKLDISSLKNSAETIRKNEAVKNEPVTGKSAANTVEPEDNSNVKE